MNSPHPLRVTVLGLALTTAACTRASQPPNPASTSAAVASHPAVATDWSRLRAPLESLFDADQNERKRVWETQVAAERAGHPWTAAEIDENWKAVKELDADNVRTLDAFLQAHGWRDGLIGTVMTAGGVAGMLVIVPAGALVDSAFNNLSAEEIYARLQQRRGGGGAAPPPRFRVCLGGFRPVGGGAPGGGS